MKNGLINNVSPGVFFYYSTLSVPPGDSTIQIAQSITTGQGNNYLFDVQQGQAKVYSSTCGNQIPGLTVNSTTTNAQVTITVTNSTLSSIPIIVGIKYSASSVAGQPVPDPDTVHYHFDTVLNNVVVNSNQNGLDLAPKP